MKEVCMCSRWLKMTWQCFTACMNQDLFLFVTIDSMTRTKVIARNLKNFKVCSSKSISNERGAHVLPLVEDDLAMFHCLNEPRPVSFCCYWLHDSYHSECTKFDCSIVVVPWHPNHAPSENHVLVGDVAYVDRLQPRETARVTYRDLVVTFIVGIGSVRNL